MVTQFAFVPTVTTAEMREREEFVTKVNNINNIRAERSQKLMAKGEEALEPYEFDYLLLCNKICGASHYNMQLKVVVDTPEDFEAWLAELPTLGEQVAAEEASNAPVEEQPAETPEELSEVNTDDEAIAQVVK
jgi:cytochrome c oxidase subunit 2